MDKESIQSRNTFKDSLGLVDLLGLGKLLDDFLNNDTIIDPDIARIDFNVIIAAKYSNFDLFPGGRLESLFIDFDLEIY